MAGEIGFVPEVADHVAVARGSFLRSLWRRRFRVRVAIMLVFGAGIGAAASLVEPDAIVGWIVFGVAVAAGWLGLIVGVTYALLPRRAARLFRQQRSLDRRFAFAWNATGIVFRSETSRSDTPWAEYHGWFESDRVFAFGLNEQLFHWAPKRAMDEGQIADLRAAATASGLPRA